MWHISHSSAVATELRRQEVACLDERLVADTALHCSLSRRFCSLHYFPPVTHKKEAIESTYRAPAVVAVWASLRAADPLIMVCYCVYLTQRAPSTKKVMAGVGEVPVEGSAVEGQSAAGTREENERCRGRRPMPSVGFSTKATNTPDGQYLGFQFN